MAIIDCHKENYTNLPIVSFRVIRMNYRNCCSTPRLLCALAILALAGPRVAIADKDLFASDFNHLVSLSLPLFKKAYPRAKCEIDASSASRTRCAASEAVFAGYKASVGAEFSDEKMQLALVAIKTDGSKTYDRLQGQMEKIFYLPQDRKGFDDPRLNIGDRNINPLQSNTVLREKKWNHLLGNTRRTIVLEESSPYSGREKMSDIKPELVMITIDYPR